ncbi:MAG: NACHT domain-containing protein, partial [Cyanobacteria bacterium J06627_32]
MQYLRKKLKQPVFAFLVIFTIAASISLTSSFPGYPQTADQPLTPRGEVTSEIEAYAKRHVNADSSMQTSTVLRIFEDNPAGLTPLEIAEIYELKYEELKAEKSADFWNQIKPTSGWIAAGLIGVLGIVWKTWGKMITRVFDTIGEGIYSRIAGNRLLRGYTLQQYRKALYKKHKKLHIPFRANRPLDMEEVYIPLQTERKGKSEQNDVERNKTEHIDAYSAIARYQRIVVTGPPGGGKSMLLKYIALAYGTNKLNLPDYPIPILLDLHRLTNPKLTPQELIQALVEAFARDNFPSADRFVQQALKGPLMLLLDGLDEVSGSARPGVVRAIKDLLDTYENCRVIITCRTAVYRDEFASIAEQTLKVSEFSDQQIRRFLRSWEPEMPPEKSIEQLLQTLRDRPRIIELARNPLMLTIIAHLYSNPSFVLPSSRAEFYQISTRILLEQWDQFRGSFNKHKPLNKRRVLQHLSLFSQAKTHRSQQDRRRMD